MDNDLNFIFEWTYSKLVFLVEILGLMGLYLGLYEAKTQLNLILPGQNLENKQEVVLAAKGWKVT